MEQRRVPLLIGLALAGTSMGPPAANSSVVQGHDECSHASDILKCLAVSVEQRLLANQTLKRSQDSLKGPVVTQFYSCFCNFGPYCPGNWWRNC